MTESRAANQSLDPGGASLAGIQRRRFVTALFSDISGSSEHAELVEAEEYSIVLGRFREMARQIVSKHGGIVARIQGDGLLALFGHSLLREDEGRRATEAALDLHMAVSGLSFGPTQNALRLKLHSGIHGGLALIESGDMERGRIDVVGEVPNTAARLCSIAGSGEIVVSEEAVGPHIHLFQGTHLGRVQIRGRTLPLNLIRIHGRATLERRIEAAAVRGTVPFVGREPIFRTLVQACVSARSGNTVTFVIEGEPGIGKSRFMAEFAARISATDQLIVSGYCESYLGAEPLQPFLQIARRVMDWGGSRGRSEQALSEALDRLGLLPELATVDNWIGVLSGVDSVPHSMRSRMLVAVLSAIANQHLLTILLDDWQWADDSSRQLLDKIRSLGLPMLIVLAMRNGYEDEIPLANVQRLSLQALSEEESVQAIKAWVPDADPFLIQDVAGLAGGNPLYLEEICHSIRSGAALSSQRPVAGVAWLSALTASRAERLSPREAEVLRAASVVGGNIEVWVLEVVADDDRLAQHLERLAAQDFLAPAGLPGVLKFKHALTRDAIYATIDPRKRRALHAAIALALRKASKHAERTQDALEALAFHFDAAGIPEDAAEFSEAAGDRALAAMALDRARAHYLTALRSLDAILPMTDAIRLKWCSIAERLGQTCVFDPLDVAQGLDYFRRAALLAREAGVPNVIARAEYWLGYVNYGKGRPREATRHCSAALEYANQSADVKLAAQVKATLGQSLASAGQYDQALELMWEAVASKRQQSRPGSGTAIGSAYTLGRIGYTLGDLGRFDEAETAFAEALELLGPNLHSVGASVRELMCVVYLWQGRWSEARAVGLEGSEMALRCRSKYLTAMGRALGACGGWAEEPSMEWLSMLRHSTYWIESRGGAVSTSLNYGWLVEAAVALDREDEARGDAVRLFARARLADRHGLAMGCRALARMAAQKGHKAQYQRYMALADRTARERGSPRELAMNKLACAEIEATLGNTANSIMNARVAAQAFEQMNMLHFLERAQAVIQAR